MKLVCYCGTCNRKITLVSNAKTRHQLMSNWGRIFTVTCKNCNVNNSVHVNIVKAETTKDITPLPTTAGGAAIGVVAGPLGMLIGGAIGGITGGIMRTNDKKAVLYFNSNYVQ